MTIHLIFTYIIVDLFKSLNEFLISKLIVCYRKFNTTDLAIYNNFSPSTSYLSTTNVVHQFEYPVEECLLNKVIPTPAWQQWLSKRLTLHLSDTSSISQHLKTHCASLPNIENCCILIYMFMQDTYWRNE